MTRRPGIGLGSRPPLTRRGSLKPSRTLARSRPANAAGWRLLVASLALIAFAFQSYVTQTHIHISQPVSVAASKIGASSESKSPHKAGAAQQRTRQGQGAGQRRAGEMPPLPGGRLRRAFRDAGRDGAPASHGRHFHPAARDSNSLAPREALAQLAKPRAAKLLTNAQVPFARAHSFAAGVLPSSGAFYDTTIDTRRVSCGLRRTPCEPGDCG